MKKTAALLIMAGACMLLLAGCISTDIGIKVNENGTGSITATVGIAEDLYNSLKDTGSDPFKGESTTVFERNGTKYIAVSNVKEYTSFEAMENALLEMSYNTDLLEEKNEQTAENENRIFKSVSITKDSKLAKSSYRFCATMNAMPKETDGYDTNELFSVSLSVEMPAEIKSVKGGTVDGNTVVFDISDIT